MPFTRFTFAIVVLAAATACQRTWQEPVIPPDDCGAAAMQNLIGTPVKKLSFSGLMTPYRIIAAGQPHTDDYNVTRLNIFTGADGVITKFTCG